MKFSHLLALGASLAGACADPSIEMSLRLPNSSQMPANFDLSCVTAVDVIIAGNDKGSDESPPDRMTSCVDVKSSPSSFTALRAAIAGKVDLALPHSGLAAVTIRGRTGNCTDNNRDFESVFYGGAGYIEGQDSMTIPIVANLSCNTKKTYAVSTIDMLALGRTKQCAMSLPSLANQPALFAGNIHPLMMGGDFPLMAWDYGMSWATPDATGKGTIESYTAAGTPRSCIAMGFGSDTNLAGSCINPGAPTLCAAPGEIELGTIDDLFAFSSIDPALSQQYGQPVFGAVWKASPAATVMKTVVTGATVELDDPAQGKVVYVEPGTSKLMPTGGTSTGASGMFILYLKGEPTGVTIKANGASQHYIVGSTGELPATLLAVLP